MYNVRKIEENINMRGDFHGRFLYDEPLALWTTFKVGGPAPLLVEPKDVPSFLMVLEELHRLSIPFLVLGGGSNLVVPDEGLEYPVVSTGSLNRIALECGGTRLVCGSGSTWRQVIDFCIEHKLGGLENFSGLPGTVGGAVYMNARCYDRSVSDVLLAADYARLGGDADGRPAVETYIMDSRQWDYKVSPFQGKLEGSPVLEVVLSVIPLDSAAADDMERRASSFVADREQKGHFSYPSAGSVFKNNRDFGKPSGRIVDEAGLRGLELGGAQVAPWHGNFIINRGNATAKDIRGLVELVQEEVCRKTGFLLEPEIIFLPKTR